MFLAGKFLPSLTLAGAAEGIFAGLLHAKKERSTAEKAADQVTNLKSKVKTPLPDNSLAYWNLARNQAKHHGKKVNEETVTINLFDEAYWMIKRALTDAATLGVRIGNQQDFENWIIANINT